MQENQLSKVYDPDQVEQKWYDEWLNQACFRAACDDREKFSIVMPPPNVTGSLHMGHALDITLQDILVRYKRMQGYDTLWMPGTDHAGIATQTKVEAHLQEEGISKHDLGREKFLEKVWDWKEEYHERIANQLRKLGVSCDWSRERFTMDEGCSNAVREVFVSLYEKGLIYQGDYIINWCPRCDTALSDIEVEHAEESGKLTHIKYPIKGKDAYITVATTRVETMLGDTAVAVNPKDDRYHDLLGETVILPIMNREIPIIADEYVDPEFGSGAVKVTPAHDPNDFDMGMRHNLEHVKVIDFKGTMTSEAGKYQGMDRFECRKVLSEDLQSEGYLLSTENLDHSIGHCQRCNTIVEPLVSKQWFVNMEPLAKPALEAVKTKETKFVPDRFEKIYTNWVENIKDWCISRQIWWGHRIPAWYCECGELLVRRETPTSCPTCGGELTQDSDVLDTWFSSALWPFSTMGWPEDTSDLQKFYPTDVLVTGYDIIFFWVARMLFVGIEFMEEEPFQDVLIHGLTRDVYGRKMSKSLGNGIDPLEIIDTYGADTLRYTLVTGNTPGSDMRFSYDKVEASRNFANKLWNASRFLLMNLEDYEEVDIYSNYTELSLSDKWILHQMETAIQDVNRLMSKYELGEASKRIYEFTWTEFCDWYIEAAKIRLYQGNKEEQQLTQNVLAKVLDNILRLLHPFMPFITEEIWNHLPVEGDAIMLADWPEAEGNWVNVKAKDDMEQIMEGVRAVRNLRSELDISPKTSSPILLFVHGQHDYENLSQGKIYFENLANATPVELKEDETDKPHKAMSAVMKGAEILMPLEGLIDLDVEIQRLSDKQQELEAEVKRAEGKLSNDDFVNKAPKEIVDQEKIKKQDYEERLKLVTDRLSVLRAMKE